MVKTVSGSVASWPATGNVTTRPLPVKELRQETNPDTREIRLVWEPHPESQQDAYKVGPHYPKICKYVLDSDRLY